MIPLGESHVRAVRARLAGATRSDGLRPLRPPHPHITIASYEGAPPPEQIRAALATTVSDIAPFVVHAHGYGLFVGETPGDLNLHVPVVRSPVLEALRVAVHTTLTMAGAQVAAWHGPDEWSPHVTLVDGASYEADVRPLVDRLLRRRHPSWHIPVDGVVVSSLRTGERRLDHVRLGGRGTAAGV